MPTPFRQTAHELVTWLACLPEVRVCSATDIKDGAAPGVHHHEVTVRAASEAAARRAIDEAIGAMLPDTCECGHARATHDLASGTPTGLCFPYGRVCDCAGYHQARPIYQGATLSSSPTLSDRELPERERWTYTTIITDRRPAR